MDDDPLDPATWREAPPVDRERVAACADAVLGIESPREAWETLAARGLLPDSAVDDPARLFEPPRGLGLHWAQAGVMFWDPSTQTARPRAGREEFFASMQPWPATVEACVRVASAWPEVLRAEALARESTSRLRAWGHDAPATAVWTRHEQSLAAQHTLTALRDDLARLAPRAEGRAGERVRGLLPGLPGQARRACTAALLGHALLREVRALPEESAALRPRLAAPSPDGGLPDPFEPCLRAFASGGCTVTPDALVTTLVTPDPVVGDSWAACDTSWLARSGPWNVVVARPRRRPARR